ncbi:hypothetical protein JXB02_03040 [Candidatus Woesearchaeota archaeon]|nr:hypothetical protein [Candidatus Woesearchaeota archaeon]
MAAEPVRTRTRIAPLSGSFMIVSMFGFIFSALLGYFGSLDKSWAFAFASVFLLMFISSMISMTYAEPEAILHIDEREKRRMQLHGRKKQQA